MNRTNIGLGIFVVGTLGLLIWLAQSIGAIGGRSGRRYEVRLEHAAGLVTNNAVKIAGVEIGTIERVGVDHDVAVLSLRIDDEVVLHDDTTAIVRAKSLLGEKYLQLHPGQPDRPVLEEDGVIENVETHFEIDQVLNALEPVLGGEDSIAAVLGPLAERLAQLLDEASGRGGAPPIITREQVDQLVDDLTTTSAAVRRIATDNEQDVRALVQRSRRLADDPRLDRTLTRVDRMTRTLDQRLPAMLDRADSALDGLEALAAVVDDERSHKLRVIIDDAAVAMSNLRELSKDFEGIGDTVRPLLKDLGRLARRAMALDGPTIRRFLQQQGVKVFVGTKREASQARGD